MHVQQINFDKTKEVYDMQQYKYVSISHYNQMNN